MEIAVPVLDTRFFVEFYGQKDVNIQKKLKDLARSSKYVSVITIHELYFLFGSFEGKEITEIRIGRIAETYDIFQVNKSIAVEGAKYRIRNRMPRADSLIAATAMEKDGIVITDDPRFTQIDDLRIKWHTE